MTETVKKQKDLSAKLLERLTEEAIEPRAKPAEIIYQKPSSQI